jgi:beta-glucosidase
VFDPDPLAERALGTLTVRVRNAGDRRGRETIQTYIAHSSQPDRRLAAFAVVEAEPGETAEVALPIPRRAAESWDEATETWVLPTGAYDLLTGRSVADIRLTTAIQGLHA